METGSDVQGSSGEQAMERLGLSDLFQKGRNVGRREVWVEGRCGSKGVASGLIQDNTQDIGTHLFETPFDSAHRVVGTSIGLRNDHDGTEKRR